VRERDLEVRERDPEARERDPEARERDPEVRECDLGVRERDLWLRERDPWVENENFWVKEPDPSQGSTADSCDERTNWTAQPGSLIPSSAKILGRPAQRAPKAAFLQPQGVSAGRSCGIRGLIASLEVRR
jgi:hypothetical protein